MKNKVYRILIIVFSLTIIFNALPLTVSAANYTSDYRYWSQGASDNSTMRGYGCWVVAQAKLIYETGVNRNNNFNPDTYLLWQQNNGYINSNFNQTNGGYAPEAYANTMGKNLTYLGSTSSSIESKIWDNISKGYYSIIGVTGLNSEGKYFSHYVMIANSLSNSNGQLYCYNSYTGSASAAPSSVASRNYVSINYLYTYSVNTHTHNYSIYEKEAIHPHKYYKKCSCGDYYYTGETATLSDCSFCTHTHNYTIYEYEAAHPHKYYKKCSCGNYYYTGETATLSNCSSCTHIHSYPSSWTNVTAATCTASGSAKRVCTSCGNTETKTLTALGHNYSSSYTIDQSATCTTTGSKSRHCTRCSSKTDVTTIDATGHTYNDAIDNIHPHKKYNICNNCEYSVDTGVTEIIDSCSLCFPVGKTVVSCNEDKFDVGSLINISWTDVERATHYKLEIYKKNANGLYETLITSQDSLTTTSYTVSGLSEGQYKIFVLSYDNTRYMPNQSDWSHQVSEPIFIKVCTSARYYDWNFNFDKTMQLFSDLMFSDGDGALLAQEFSKGYIDEIDVYEDGVINHPECPNRPGYRFTEWKKMLEPTQSVYSITHNYYIFQAQYEPLLFSKGECLYGDLNFDGKTNILDLIRIKKMLLGDVENHINADLDADNNTNAIDVTLLRKVLLNKSINKSLYFDANEGTLDETQRLVSCGKALGGLPTPTRTGFDFVGWFTDDNVQLTSETLMPFDKDVTAFAHWTPKTFNVSWNTGIGYSVSVNRTNSPYANASVGELSNGESIYYGDVLIISYSSKSGYSLNTKGLTSATVSGNITSSDIYATASANSYIYDIVCKSSNGTILGTGTAKFKYDTTNTIPAASFNGYITPPAQSVTWDSVTTKTITFIYSPISVPASQNVANGVWGISGNTNFLTFSVNAEYRNRTSTSVQVRIIWTNTILAGYFYQRGQVYNATVSGQNTGAVTIVPYNTWLNSASSNRSLTGTSNWITVPVSATQTSISISGSAYRQHSDGSLVDINESWSYNLSIPTY